MKSRIPAFFKPFKNPTIIQVRRCKSILVSALMVTGLCFASVPKMYAQPGTRPNQLFFSPVRIVDIVNPGIELGYRRMFSPSFASQVSVGYMTDLIGVGHMDNYEGLRLVLEQVFLFPGKEEANGNQERVIPFIAVELTYLNARYATSAEFTTDTSSYTAAYWDDFNIHKNTVSLNTRFGLQVAWGRVAAEFSLGYGLKYRSARRSGLDNPEAVPIPPRHPLIMTAADRESNALTLNLPANFRIAYSF